MASRLSLPSKDYTVVGLPVVEMTPEAQRWAELLKDAIWEGVNSVLIAYREAAPVSLYQLRDLLIRENRNDYQRRMARYNLYHWLLWAERRAQAGQLEPVELDNIYIVLQDLRGESSIYPAPYQVLGGKCRVNTWMGTVYLQGIFRNRLVAKLPNLPAHPTEILNYCDAVTFGLGWPEMQFWVANSLQQPIPPPSKLIFL